LCSFLCVLWLKLCVVGQYMTLTTTHCWELMKSVGGDVWSNWLMPYIVAVWTASLQLGIPSI
jgi:hypothetical protein